MIRPRYIIIRISRNEYNDKEAKKMRDALRRRVNKSRCGSVLHYLSPKYMTKPNKRNGHATIAPHMR